MVVAGMVMSSTLGQRDRVRSFQGERKLLRVDGALAPGSAVICVLLSAIYRGLW